MHEHGIPQNPVTLFALAVSTITSGTKQHLQLSSGYGHGVSITLSNFQTLDYEDICLLLVAEGGIL